MAEPADVLDALGSLQVDAEDGLAGPALDFAESEAVPDDAVVAVQSTAQDPGLRPASPGAAPRLHWFARVSPTRRHSASYRRAGDRQVGDESWRSNRDELGDCACAS